jgi:hypothetical protein
MVYRKLWIDISPPTSFEYPKALAESVNRLRAAAPSVPDAHVREVGHSSSAAIHSCYCPCACAQRNL